MARRPWHSEDNRRSNLAAQPTPLIGRTREMLEARQLLLREDVRLLTFVGPAGTGKTRLAVAVAESVLDSFSDGVFFVDLTPVTDPTLVTGAIARTLQIEETGTRSLLERLREALQSRTLLLVLDNFEHVIAAAPDLAYLMTSGPKLKILATSRAALKLRWEYQYPVPALELPDLHRLPPLDVLEHVPAIALFTHRARAIQPEFRLTKENAGAVAEICSRLDGLPLAIELAAARSKLLSPMAIRARLRRRLDLLVSHAQDQPARHHTLREAIGWSYGLLAESEQTLFRRLSVFVGSISPEAAWAACTDSGARVEGIREGETVTERREGTEPCRESAPDLHTTVPRHSAPSDSAHHASDVLEMLASLTDQSMLRQEILPNGEPSFRMLETVREYALERVVEANELDLVRRRHAAHYVAIAEQAAPELHGAAQVEWLDYLEHQQGNLRAALEWCSAGSNDVAGYQMGLRMAAALGWFWFLRGNRGEGRSWLERFATLTRELSHTGRTRAQALGAAGWLAQYLGENARAKTLLEESLALGQELADESIVAVSLSRLASLAWATGEFERAKSLATEGLSLCRKLGDRWETAFALGVLGGVARTNGHVEEAESLLTESAKEFRTLGSRWGTAHVLTSLGQLALHRGDLDRADALWRERLKLSRELGNRSAIAHAFDLVGVVARRRGDFATADTLYTEALDIRREIGDRQASAWTLHELGELALDRGDCRTARARFQESLLLRSELADRAGIAASLEAFARLAVVEAQPRRAWRLAAAAAALHNAIGPSLAAQHYSKGVLSGRFASSDPLLERARDALSRPDQDAAWAEGWELSVEQAIADALAEKPRPSSETPTRSEATKPGVLTPREREVAALLARGFTNRQIGTALVITEGTAHLHVVHILEKLGFHSRAQAAAWAVQHGLVENPPA